MISYPPAAASSSRRDVSSPLEKTNKPAASPHWDKAARKGFFTAAATIVFLLFYLPSALGLNWQEAKDTHFIVYHYKEDNEFAKNVLRGSESHYQSIPGRLGLSQSFSFWTWENRVKIYIYPDRATFLEQTESQGWSRAIANYRTKVISFYKGSDEASFLNTTLPHELTHLLFREFVGVNSQLPVWVDEGAAQLMEEGKANKAMSSIKELLGTDYFISVDTLMRLDIRRVREKELVTIFYLESCALLDFLIKNYGGSEFERFCKKISEGKTFEEAFATSYSSAEELNKRWIEYIKQF